MGKYIKLYENFNKSELLNYCEEGLAYLIDDGFSVSVYHFTGDYYANIIISSKKINWFSIRDRVLPFLEILLDEYELSEKPIYYLQQINNLVEIFNLESLESLESLANVEMFRLVIKVKT